MVKHCEKSRSRSLLCSSNILLSKFVCFPFVKDFKNQKTTLVGCTQWRCEFTLVCLLVVVRFVVVVVLIMMIFKVDAPKTKGEVNDENAGSFS